MSFNPDTEYHIEGSRLIHDGRREFVYTSDQFIRFPFSRVLFRLKAPEMSAPFTLVTSNYGSRFDMELDSNQDLVPLHGRPWRNSEPPAYATATLPFLVNWKQDAINIFDLLRDEGRFTLRVAVDTMKGRERVWVSSIRNASEDFPSRRITQLVWKENYWVVEEPMLQVVHSNGYSGISLDSLEDLRPLLNPL